MITRRVGGGGSIGLHGGGLAARPPEHPLGAGERFLAVTSPTIARIVLFGTKYAGGTTQVVLRDAPSASRACRCRQAVRVEAVHEPVEQHRGDT